jgi:hypothetical protein
MIQQPQKQFQHQFHTQFVSGLSVGNGPPSPIIDAAGGENKKERDGRRSAGNGNASANVRPTSSKDRDGGSADREKDRDRGLGRDRDRERERERDREVGREREREMVRERDRDRDREREREMARDRDVGRERERESYSATLKPSSVPVPPPANAAGPVSDKPTTVATSTNRPTEDNYGSGSTTIVEQIESPSMQRLGGIPRSSSVIHGSQQQQQGQYQHGQHPQSQSQSHHQQQHPSSHPRHPDSMMIDVEDHNPPMMGLPPPSHPLHHQQHQMQEMHRRQGSLSHHSHGMVGYGGDGRERERGVDRDRDRAERERERDRGMEREKDRDRGMERDRDRDRERERDVDMLDASSGHHARQQGVIVVDEARGDEGWYGGSGPGGGGTEYPGSSGYDHRHGISQQHPPHHHHPQAHQYRIPPPPPPPSHHSHSHSHHQHPQHPQHPHPHPQQHHPNQQQQPLPQRKEFEGQPLVVNNAPPHTGVATAPSGHLQIHVYDSELDTAVAQNVGTAGPGLAPSPGPTGLGPGGNDNPPAINPSSTLIDDWDLDIAIEEESRSWNRARVGVHLGTFVFPRLPFPYFFELGSGLVGVKEREEERERAEKEGEENERREKEEREKEKAEDEKKANGEKEKVDADNIAMKIEEGEIVEKEVDEKEIDKTSDTDRGIEIQLQKNDSKDILILIQGKNDSPQHQQDPQLPQPPLLDIETRTTIIIPTGYIPVDKPLRPKLWGGGGFDPRPRPPPLRMKRSKNGGLNGKGRHQQQPQLQSRPSSTKPSLLSASANTSLNSSASSSSSNNPALPISSSKTRTRRPRRIYTDDSDIFLCAIHSGWVTWSGARKARLKGRDMRIEVRMMRCAGVGGGIESLSDSGEGESERGVKEEMIGRFVGGYGERCFNPLGKSGRVAGEEGDGGGGGEEEEEEEEEGGLMLDDPDDDGRSLVSAAWGSGHDGSAIEIVNVEFVDVSSSSFSFMSFSLNYHYRRVLHALLAVLVDEIVLNDFWNTLRGELVF